MDLSDVQVLAASYFFNLAVAVLAGLFPWLILRGAFRRLCAGYISRPWVTTLPRLFLLGIVLPPVVGFTSVSYFSCSHTTYERIVTDREHLIAVSREQFAWAFSYGIVAILVWCALAAILVSTRDRQSGSPKPKPNRDVW